MTKSNRIKRAAIGTALAAALAAGFAASAPAPAAAQPSSGYRPTREVLLSLGEGELISLPRNVANVWTSNPEVADVQVNTPRQIGLFGKSNGEATIIATAADGSVVYGAHVRVSQNISSVDEMLRAAMPGSNITVTNVGQMAVINGTVASPEDSAQAEMLVRAALNPGISPTSADALRILPVNRLRIATPQQVLLQVRIAEVNRTLVREIGVNLLTRDQTGGFRFGLGRGNAGTITDRVNGIIDPATGQPTVTGTNFGAFLPAGPTTIAAAGHLLGIDILSSLNLGEQTGLVTTLAEPSLVALSGETSNFLAGGEFPIPVSQSLGAVTIEYKTYGVGLAFSPIVLEDGRIQMRVRPEVSELSNEGTIRLNGFNVPALTVRRAETTVELGSGQSFMIAGLLRNHNTNSIDRAPFLGNIPILGALFRSTRYQRAETELVIVVTPYLVRPVSSPSQIALPTDGHRNPDEAQRVLIGQANDSRSGEQRPGPVVAPARTVAPGITTGNAAPAVPNPAPPARETRAAAAPPPNQPSAQPGFSF
jgi:pilus assembly protein CpaC